MGDTYYLSPQCRGRLFKVLARHPTTMNTVLGHELAMSGRVLGPLTSMGTVYLRRF